MAENTADRRHDVSVVGRKKVTLTGVEDVVSYDDGRIALKTSLGGLVIAGSGLKLGRLDTSGGGAEIEGTVRALEYTDGVGEKGFFRKIFR
ncbi:MAG: sporulation protein YabP [Clostridia bacterium]|nr:sporulation protein YabP [Clostridia bacterium]